MVEAVRSLLATTDHPTLEVVVVYDEPTPTAVLDELREIAGDRLTLVPLRRGPFNYSRKMNLGVLHARGDHLVLLNDDLEAISEGWLEQLVAPLLEPDVGMTGGKLYFSNDTIQHAGHAYTGKNYKHPFMLRAAGLLRAVRRADRQPRGVRRDRGLRRACAARSSWRSAASPRRCPSTSTTWTCPTRSAGKGYRIVWIANVEMYHFESRTRQRVVEGWEKDLTVERWGMPRHDQYLPEA